MLTTINEQGGTIFSNNGASLAGGEGGLAARLQQSRYGYVICYYIFFLGDHPLDDVSVYWTGMLTECPWMDGHRGPCMA